MIGFRCIRELVLSSLDELKLKLGADLGNKLDKLFKEKI